MFQDEGSSVPTQSYPIGSLIVMPGCTYTGYLKHEFDGQSIIHEGPLTIPFLMDFVSVYYEVCDQIVFGHKSYTCDCIQKLVTCEEPADQFVEVATCDNLDGKEGVNITCTFSETIGTLYTDEAMTSLAVSYAVEETIQHELQNLYATELGVSSKTDYDWGAADINVFMSEVTENVEYVVPAGYKVKHYMQSRLYCRNIEHVFSPLYQVTVDQVIGFCDENESRTDYFRYTSTTAEGKATVSYPKRARDGRRVKNSTS